MLKRHRSNHRIALRARIGNMQAGADRGSFGCERQDTPLEVLEYLVQPTSEALALCRHFAFKTLNSQFKLKNDWST